MGRLFSKQVNRNFFFFLRLLSTQKYPEHEQKVYCALTVGLQHYFYETSLYKQQESHFNCIHQARRPHFQNCHIDLNFGSGVSH